MCFGMLLTQVNINMLYEILDKQSGLFFSTGFYANHDNQKLHNNKNTFQIETCYLFIYLLLFQQFLKVPPPLPAPKMYYKPMIGL